MFQLNQKKEREINILLGAAEYIERAGKIKEKSGST